MGEKVTKTGNEAMAEAMRQINPDVVAAYPITPATEIAQIFARFVADGLVDTEFVAVESEHSAMSATVGAAAAGARAMTATSSQGLALMYEILPIASALRLPIVMPEVNRALSGPINIHCDHSDTMGARDFGWIQVYAENAQEAYDVIIQAVRVAEHKKVRLPMMVSTDGFIISHCLENMEMLDDKEIKDFIGTYSRDGSLLNIDEPVSVGAIDLQDYFFEHKRTVAEGMFHAREVILEIAEEFAKKFGRKYGMVEEYKLSDAEVAIVAMGSTAGTARTAINELRSKGIKAGMLKICVFRPFPFQEIVAALKKVKVVAVLDRVEGLNSFASPTFSEVRAVLYDEPARPKMVNYIYGLGGRDISVEEIKGVFKDLEDIKKTGKVKERLSYLGVRE